MKKVKRIFAVILSVLLLATAFSLNAFAATLVDTIDLTVDVEPGMMMENYEEYITINTAGVSFAEEAQVFVSEVYEDEYYWPYNNYFEPGCVYEIMIILDVTDGYVFAERESLFESVTVNGEEVYFEAYISETEIEKNLYAVYATVGTEGSISDIELTVAPVAGYMISDYYRYVHIDSLGVVFEETLDNGVIVTDAQGGDPFDYFVEEEYVLEICLTPAWGCEFTKDDAGNIQLGNVTVNGEAVEYTSHIEDNRGYIEYVTLKVNVTPQEKTPITVIELSFEQDLKGYAVEDYEEYITIETPGVSFDVYDPFAVWAYDSDYEEIYTFDGGDHYCLCMSFITEDGYFFDPDGVVVSINGEEYAYVDYYTYETEDGISVECIYTEYETAFVGTTFDSIIAWFRSIFEFIGNILFGWIFQL
ncbi:MAG: hypothetical protein IKK09_11910 [Clostridia bacterium]|nr:hypothetical protein [Clostridia bacterium]